VGRVNALVSKARGDAMSLRDFWGSVRRNVGFIAPKATVDSPRLDAGAIERGLRATTLWLTPRVVAGFDEAEFEFLPEGERRKLSHLVKEFREVAGQVPPTAPADKDLVAKALPLFRDLVGMLAFDRYGDAEAYRLGKQIERAIADRRPPELAELRFNTGADSTGDPAIWIWAILKDEAAAKPVFAQTTRSIRELLSEAAAEAAPDLWPYVRFRTVAEQAELLGAARS
jgi:hypothetical protein